MSNKSIQELKRIASEKITNVIVAGGVDNKIEGELFENILEILDKRLSTIDDDTIQGLITFSNGLISNAIADFKVGIKVTGKADIQNLTTQIAEITEKLIVKLIEAENIDLSGSIKSKSAEITEKLAVCLTEAENITVTDTLTAFMSVIRRLTAKTAVIEQEISSIDYVESLLGWYIRQDGTAQLKGLKLLEFLEAPEFRYNRVTVLAGESWRGSGAGLIESVDEAKQIVYLKLEAGDIMTADFDDICKGIYHTGNGYETVFFRVTEKVGNTAFKYSLRPGYSTHPQAFMNFISYGNFSKTERQNSVQQTTSYQRFLSGVNDWDITPDMIKLQIGDSAINVFGSGKIWIGNKEKTKGWEITEGHFLNVKNGFALTEDGEIEAPDGLSIKIGSSTLDKYTAEKALENVYHEGRNLVIQSQVDKGKFLNAYGAEVEHKDWFVTDFICVKDIDILTASGFGNLASSPATGFYDKDKKWIRGVTNANISRNEKMIPQAGEEYLRFSAELIDLETLKIEAGDKATPYLLSPEDLELLIEMTGYDSAGGINLFNTVDCALLNMQNISNRRWTDTGFAFTTSATTGLTKKLRLLSVFRSPGYYTLSAKVRTTQAVNVTLNLEINGTSEDFIISTTPTIISMTAYVESIVQNKFPTFTTTVGAETIYIDELMVEFGRNASPYAPAPRDIPAKIDVAVNNIKITADKISFTNQSGTSFADMFNDPATGNPTLKGEFIEADNLTAAALKLKFSELTNDTISVNDSTPANINGTNKTIILPCDQAAYEGKTITVFNDRKWIRQQNVSEIAGCTVIKCENGIGNGLTDIAKKEFQDGVWGGVGSAGTRAGRYGSSSDANKIQEYLFTEITDDPEYMHIYGGAVQLTCAKEHIYDTTLEDWKTVLRWVVTGGKFYHVQDYVEQPVLFLVSGNHTRYIVTDKVNSLTAATASTVYLSNSQETVVLGSGFNLPIKLPSRCVLGKEIKIVNKSGSSRTVTCHDMDLTGQGYIREMGSATNKTSQTIENGTTYVFTRISAQRWEYYLL